MPTSTDVTLDRDRPPVFPARCVACGLPGPTDTYRATGESGGWLWGWFAQKHHVDAPACGPCVQALVFQRRYRAALLWVFMAVGAGVGFLVLPEFGVPVKKWTVLGVALVFLLPYALWVTLVPVAFDIIVHRTTVEYEFRDPEYAAEFAGLNPPPADE